MPDCRHVTSRSNTLPKDIHIKHGLEKKVCGHVMCSNNDQNIKASFQFFPLNSYSQEDPPVGGGVDPVNAVSLCVPVQVGTPWP